MAQGAWQRITGTCHICHMPLGGSYAVLIWVVRTQLHHAHWLCVAVNLFGVWYSARDPFLLLSCHLCWMLLHLTAI